MNRLLKRSITFFAALFFTFIVVVSCDKDMGVMLDNSATSNVGVTILDTFTVNTSTAQLWERPSAGIERILVGRATVPPTGTVKSTSYFRIGSLDMTNDIPEAAQFDSLSLVLRPSGDAYSFGDTTEVQTIHAHQLTAALARRTPNSRFPNEELPWYLTRYNISSSIFTDQTFDYQPTPMGSVSFLPHLHSLDSVSIRLDDQTGEDFFQRIKTSDIQLTSYENFREYFRGIVLVPDESNTTVIGFSDTLEVRVNYSYPGIDGHKRTGFKSLNIVERAFQYNNITHDRSGTAFEALSTREEVSTTATDGLTYVQAGTGVVAKISFPSLQEFLHTENMAINKAELVIETSSRANTMYPIPRNLALFVNDHYGVPRSVLSRPYEIDPATREAPLQVVPFVPGSEMGQNGTYTFNLMGYLQQLKSLETRDNTSFYLTTNPIDTQIQSQNPSAPAIAIPPHLLRTFDTALIATEDGKPKIKLRILYTKFR